MSDWRGYGRCCVRRRSSARKLTTAQWVERTWRSLGGDAYLTADEMANARRYLQLLDEVEEQGGMLDLTLLERRIDRLYAEPCRWCRARWI